MLPWSHLATGYLSYTLFVHVVYRTRPPGWPTIALAFGTQFPDLVDKPLNWWFNVLDGRGIGHSLFVVVPLCLVVLWVSDNRRHRALGVAFVIGVVTHLLGDMLPAVLAGDLTGAVSYLLWPLFPAPTYASDSFLDHLLRWRTVLTTLPLDSPVALLRSGFIKQLLVSFAVFLIWAVDGFPGVRAGWRLLADSVARFRRDTAP